MGVGFCPLCAGAAQLSAVPFRDDANREIGVPRGVLGRQTWAQPTVTLSGSAPCCNGRTRPHSTEVALTATRRSPIMMAVWRELECLVCLTAGA